MWKISTQQIYLLFTALNTNYPMTFRPAPLYASGEQGEILFGARMST